MIFKMYQMAKYEPTLRRAANPTATSPPLGIVIVALLLVRSSSVAGTDRADVDLETTAGIEVDGAMLVLA
jgi:hypothetical protein